MQYRYYIAGCLVVLSLVVFACEERQLGGKVKRSKLADQNTTLDAQELVQREQELSQKAADIESLMVKLERKESELLNKENRLLEFEKKLRDEETQLIEKRKSLEKFRMTSITIMILGILFLTGGVVLIYKAQQKKIISDSTGFKKASADSTHLSKLEKPAMTGMQGKKSKKPTTSFDGDKAIDKKHKKE